MIQESRPSKTIQAQERGSDADMSMQRPSMHPGFISNLSQRKCGRWEGGRSPLATVLTRERRGRRGKGSSEPSRLPQPALT
eukprot:99280-Chlamydomonas_euryale.AAC.1